MFRLPYSRRKRERLLHKLWIYLTITTGVLILVLLDFFKAVSDDDSLPSHESAPYRMRPAQEPRSSNYGQFIEAQESKEVIIFDEPFFYDRNRDRAPWYPPIANGGIGSFVVVQDISNGKAIPVNVSIELDPVLIKTGQYHYTNVIVHFDLKGAPPKVDYFLDLLELIADAGATGILIEWEDMFPWSGELEIVKNTNAYTVDEVKRILQKATDLNLEMIPLVQTFGHLEWILKFEKFRAYRDDDRYPQVICLGNKKAMDLIKMAILQVVEIHLPYGISHFHIGADEAFQYGTCNASKKALSGEDQEMDLALKHIRAVANYTRKVTNNAQILAWHDMFKNFVPDKLHKYDLKQVLELVIWDYSEDLRTMPREQFLFLADHFPTVWASSAFKGADFPGATFSNIQHYERNNLKWQEEMRELRKTKGAPKFAGIIITGWSRYDHMATLCEILPVGTPSMVLNIQIALIGADPKYDKLPIRDISASARSKTYEILDCSNQQTTDIMIVTDFMVNGCYFSGTSVHDTIETLHARVNNHNAVIRGNEKMSGWLSRYNLAYNTSQSWHLNEIYNGLQPNQFIEIAGRLERQMSQFFHTETVDEFLFSKVDPYIEREIYYRKMIGQLKSVRTHERRSFKIERKKYEKMPEDIPAYD